MSQTAQVAGVVSFYMTAALVVSPVSTLRGPFQLTRVPRWSSCVYNLRIFQDNFSLTRNAATRRS